MDRKPPRTRYPGITADARELGVHRTTLYKMLRGVPGFAGLRTLRRRYEALKTRQAEAQDAAGSMSAVRILAPGETPCKNSSASCTKASRVNCRLGHPTSR